MTGFVNGDWNDIAPIVKIDYEKPTFEFRWYQLASWHPTVLQQRFVLANNDSVWRDVPTVVGSGK
jgi:hypothetical protein